jgi:hypothetical protein
VACHRAELGKQAGKVALPGRVEPSWLPGQGVRAQPRHHRPVGERPLRRIRARLGGCRSALGAPGTELLHQPALAGTGLAGHQHQPGSSTLGSPPQPGQVGPLGRPPDERGPAEQPRPSRFPLDGRLAPGRQQLLIGPAGRRRGLNLKFTLQGRGARVVGAKRPGPVAAGVVEPHQHPVGGLAERVRPQDPLRVRDRLGVLAPGLHQLDQPFEGLEPAPPQPFPLLQQPLVVAALQQVTPVQLDGLTQGRHLLVGPLGPVGPGDRALEGGQVDPARGALPPPERPRGHLQEPVGTGQGAPQDVQQMAQVGPRLGLARVGPEQVGQALARLRRIPVEQQIGEQRLGPGRAERRHRGLALAEVELAEDPDAQRGRRLVAHARSSSWRGSGQATAPRRDRGRPEPRTGAPARAGPSFPCSTNR